MLNDYKEDIAKSIEVMRSGGIILYPTDTIWGLGCDATNRNAVEKIFSIKNRAEQKSMIILVDEDNKLMRFVRNIPEVAWDLIELSEKPLTIIYPGALGLAPNVIAEDGSVGIRVVKDDFCKQLIHKYGKAIVSTSANISGEASPAFFAEINNEIKSKVDYIVKHRQEDNTPKQPSSIIKLGLSGEIKIIRK